MPARAEPTCGNGRVERGELCDPNVEWAEHCPEPWGLCWKCGPSCTTWTPTTTELVESIHEDVYCTQTIPGSTTARTYDAHGFVLAQQQDWPDQHSSSKIVFHRDASGWLTGIDHDFTNDRSGLTQSRVRHELDGTHRRVRSWDETRPGDEWRYEYGLDGLLVRISGGHAVDGVPETDRRFVYDTHGRTIADVTTFRDTTWHSSTLFRYDRLGRQTDHVLGASDKRGHPAFDCHTDYPAAGSRRCCTFSSPPSTSCWTNDSHGTLVELTSRQPTGSSTERRTNVYDRRGLLARSTVFDGDGAVARIERSQFDDRANLVSIDRATYGGPVERVETRTYDCLRDVFARMPKRGFTERAREEPTPPADSHTSSRANVR